MTTHSACGKSPDIHPAPETPTDDVQLGDAVRLQGYLGPEKDDKTLRLYTSFEDLSEYIDVPRDQVLKSIKASEVAAPNGGVYAWVKPDAQIIYTRTQSVTAQARDLGGASIQDAKLVNEFRRRNPRATVLASLTVGTSSLAFVEFLPGLTGIVESAPVGQSLKIDTLRGRTLSSVYSELSQLPAPPALLYASGRTMKVPPARAPKAPQVLNAHGVGAGSISTPATLEASPIHVHHVITLTVPEQSWFNSTYCNGAHVCVQGWDWANSGNIEYDSYEVVTMVGSEGTVNANLQLFYWESFWCIFGSDGFWFEFYNAINVPGHVIGVNVTGATAGATFASLSGAGGGTTVSMAVR